MRSCHLTMPRLYLAALSVLGLSFLGGCAGAKRPGTVAVTGQVTLDGKPLAGASVMFTGPEGGAPVTAVTDAQGKFSLEAAAGLNSVAVAKTEGGGSGGEADLAPVEAGETVAPPRSVIPRKYANPKTSGITVEVKAGMGPVTIELKSSE